LEDTANEQEDLESEEEYNEDILKSNPGFQQTLQRKMTLEEAELSINYKMEQIGSL
jgi:hypothetical protein